MPIVVLLALFACRPPEAPDTFAEMMVFGFVHFDDEDPDSLQSLGEKMIPWLDGHLEETLEGYETAPMTPTDLVEAGIDAPDRNAIVGVAVGLDYTVGVMELAGGITHPNQDEIFDIYLEFERKDLTDRDCFLARDCEFHRTEDSLHSDVGLGIELWTDYQTNFRNVDLEDGTEIVIHQSVTDHPVDFNIEAIAVYQQYGFSLAWERDDGTTRRAQAMWADMELLEGDAGEGFHLNLTINSMQNGAENMDAYLNGEVR